MTFEEQFPSLKGFSCGIYINALRQNNKKTFEEDDIQKHCLDKQRVKEVIERLSREDRLKMMGLIDMDDLLKELGLEDEE